MSTSTKCRQSKMLHTVIIFLRLESENHEASNFSQVLNNLLVRPLIERIECNFQKAFSMLL